MIDFIYVMLLSELNKYYEYNIYLGLEICNT